MSQSHLPSDIESYGKMDDKDEMDYRFESARFNSFKNWSISYVDPKELAIAGFYYFGKDDFVRCFYCDVVVGKWQEGDKPIVEHKKLSPTCNFVKRMPSDTLPILQNVKSSEKSRDECGIYKDEYLCYTACMENMMHPNYWTYGSRFRSFDSWDEYRTQTKDELAKTGFFYEGTDDRTVCFCCGLNLHSWLPEENPWEMHCFWMPNCCYLLSIKGQDYPQRVRQALRQRNRNPEQRELPSRALLAIEPPDESVPEEHRNPQMDLAMDPENVSFERSSQLMGNEEGASGTSVAESHTFDVEHGATRLSRDYRANAQRQDVLFVTRDQTVTCPHNCVGNDKKCLICGEEITFKIKEGYI